MEPMKGKWASSHVDLGYTELFCFPEVTVVFHLSCDTGRGDSLVFHQHIEAPYVFDWEHGLAMHSMQGILASSSTQGNISRDFSTCSRNLGYIVELQQGWPFETPLCSVKSGHLCS